MVLWCYDFSVVSVVFEVDTASGGAIILFIPSEYLRPAFSGANMISNYSELMRRVRHEFRRRPEFKRLPIKSFGHLIAPQGRAGFAHFLHSRLLL